MFNRPKVIGITILSQKYNTAPITKVSTKHEFFHMERERYQTGKVITGVSNDNISSTNLLFPLLKLTLGIIPC